MSDADNCKQFESYLHQLRSGDISTVGEFVSKYEPYIRRAIRFRIKDSTMMAAADSVDVCQSVLGGFLFKLSAGDYDIQSEGELKNLLISIARKKFSMLRRREQAAKRSRDLTRSLQDLGDLPTREQAPIAAVEIAELADRAKLLLTKEEWELVKRRRDGQSWHEIEQDLKVSGMVLRKRLSRAIHRVAGELGIEL